VNAILRALAIVLALAAAPAQAAFHLWAMNELYSNADGTVQFVELTALEAGQQFIAGHSLKASSGGNTNTFIFPSNLPGDTAGKRMLVATQGFAALGIVTPDYVVPNNFFFRNGGTVNFADVDVWNHPALPTNNQSLDRSGASIPNSPTNFAGASGTIPVPVANAQRVFVASYGNDDDAFTGCRLTAPCRGFAAAMGQVAAGGEVVALDAAGYGAVTIDKSVTITTNPGYFAGISVSSGDAINIEGSDAHVILRGLNINGLGGSVGIRLVEAASLTMENCVVSNFQQHGIHVNWPAKVRITDTTVRGNGLGGAFDGIWIGGSADATLHKVRMSNNTRSGLRVENGTTATTVGVTDSDASGNGVGFIAAFVGPASARLTIRGSTASQNTIGFAVDGMLAFMSVSDSSAVGNGTGFSNVGGILETYANNLLRYNTTPTSGPTFPVAGQ